MLQDIEIKKEVWESLEFKEENYDYINDVKEESYNDNDLGPISDVAIIKLEKEYDYIEKDNDHKIPSQKTTDRIYKDKTQILQTEYGSNPMNVKPFKVVSIQVELSNERQLNFCKMCKRTFYSLKMFRHHQSNANCGQKAYPCHLCERSYCERNILFMHQTIVHGHDQIVTNYSNRKYSNPTWLELRNRNGPRLKYKVLELKKKHQNCVVCNKIFNSKLDLNNHKNHSLIHKVHLVVQSLK